MSSTTTKQILDRALDVIEGLKGHTLNVVEVAKPPDLAYARHLAKVISKLSPLVGNMIDFALADVLNEQDWKGGKWVRQDPDFPDLLFLGDVTPAPGVEIKTWFPFATEITARFKDSVTLVGDECPYVALITWLPKYILYGKPQVIDVWMDTARSLAQAREAHYHNPPDYLVVEPEDTSDRTRNLQQTNVAGYKFQGSEQELERASREVARWPGGGLAYSPNPDYQERLSALMGAYRYRLDTNFAKMDRIDHQSLEKFKAKVLEREIFGHTISYWGKHGLRNDASLQKLLDAKSSGENMVS